MIQFPSFPHCKIFLTALVLVMVSVTALVAQNTPPKEAAPAGTGQIRHEQPTHYGKMTTEEFHKGLDAFIKAEEIHDKSTFFSENFVTDCETSLCKTFNISFPSAAFVELVPDQVIFFDQVTKKVYGGLDSRDFTTGKTTQFKLPLGEYIMVFKHHMYDDIILRDDASIKVTLDNMDEIGNIWYWTSLKDNSRHLFPGSVDNFTDPQGLHIYGHITDASNGKPLTGVKVSVKQFYPNYKGDKDITAITDDRGYYYSEKAMPFLVGENATYSYSGYSGMKHEDQKITLEFEYPNYEYDLRLSNGPPETGISTWDMTAIHFNAALKPKFIPNKANVIYDLKKLRQVDNQAKFLNSSMESFACTLPSTIRVGINCTGCTNGGGCTQYACTYTPYGNNQTVTVIDLPFEKYLRAVLVQEWISESWGTYTGGAEALRAGAVAVRTFGAFWKNKSPQLNSNYSIGDGVCWQDFIPSNFKKIMEEDPSNPKFPQAKAALDYTAGWALRSGTSFPKSEYAAETNDNLTQGNCNSNYNGNSCGDGHFRKSDQISSTCYPLYGIDYVSLGFSDCKLSHPRGMSQRGTFRWATGRYISNTNSIGSNIILPATFNGITYCSKDWQKMLAHYYPYYTLENCITNTVVNLSNISQVCNGNGGLNCTNAISLTNGVPSTGNNGGGSSNVTTYNCQSGWAESGPEKIYSYNHTGGTVTLKLTETSGADVDAFLLNSCSATNCLLAVNNGVSSYANAPAGIYYVVVDGYQGAIGNYTLTVSSSVVGGLNCNNTVSLSNGVPYNGSNAGGGNNVSTYNCQSGWAETGPEKVHTYYHTGGMITINLAQSVDVDAFLLGSCLPSNCLLAVDNGVATYPNASAGTYYVVVDGYVGAIGNYTLTVSSTGGGGGLPNLTDNGSSRSNSGRNVSLTVKVTNNSSNNAGPFVTRIWLSTDTYFENGNDYYIAYSNYPSGLTGGTSNTASGTIFIPSSVPAGNYYVLEKIDFVSGAWNGAVTESNENDNAYYLGPGTTFYLPPSFSGLSDDYSNLNAVEIKKSVYTEEERSNEAATLLPFEKSNIPCVVTVSGFQISTSPVDENTRYIVVNTLGQIICQGKATGGVITCSANTPGIYFITIVDGIGNRCTQKVFVN